MKLRIMMALALAPGIACNAGARDGGKIGWKAGDVKAAMADARTEGKAMMLFFTSEG
jgi:hypothetical protein